MDGLVQSERKKTRHSAIPGRHMQYIRYNNYAGKSLLMGGILFAIHCRLTTTCLEGPGIAGLKPTSLEAEW